MSRTRADVLAGSPTMGGSRWDGVQWIWFVAWTLDGVELRRIEGMAKDAHDVINQQRAVVGLPGIEN